MLEETITNPVVITEESEKKEEATNALDLVAEDEQLFAVAETATKRVNAIKAIINASLSITTKYDWCLIGDTPYLQESGALKIARMFGISWDIVPGYPVWSADDSGHKTCTYRMKFTMGKNAITCEGSRSSKGGFFGKNLDTIDWRNVQISAQTNAINVGIKHLIPGLKNIDAQVLKDAGINLDDAKGYNFKEGAKGGQTKTTTETYGTCEICGKQVNSKGVAYSKNKHDGHVFCYACDHEEGKVFKFLNGQQAKKEEPVEEEIPPFDPNELPY